MIDQNLKDKLKTDYFISKAKLVHGDKYDYSNVIYYNARKPVEIKCPKGHVFYQIPYVHLSGSGCPTCYGNHIYTQDEMISEFKKKHGDKYDYSKVNYVNTEIPVTIICPKHGEFKQAPHYHKSGQGCPMCAKDKLANFNRIRRKVPIEEFIKRAKRVHGDKYDYSKVNYELTSDKVIIICPKHGEFTQEANSHLMGKGCKLCANEEIGLKCRLGAKEFLKRARKVHGDKYKYDLSNYKLTRDKIKIICPKHGEFTQEANGHLQGKGCLQCAIENSKWDKEDLLNEFKKIHGDRYTYPEFDYQGVSKPIPIMCHKHGIFYQTPGSHLRGRGCPKCAREITGLKCRWDFDEFVKEARKIHGDTYHYIQLLYDDGKSGKVQYECPYHGLIEQSINGHLKGYGCKHCGVLPTPGYSAGELKIKKFLDFNKIGYIQEWVMPDTKFRYDFYIPSMNLLIEYDGKQHYQYIPFIHNGNIENFHKQVENDRLKDSMAVAKKIDIIRVSYKVKDVYEYLRSNITRRVMYYRDGKYFKNFYTYGKYFNINPKDTYKDHVKYRLALNADVKEKDASA